MYMYIIHVHVHYTCIQEVHVKWYDDKCLHKYMYVTAGCWLNLKFLIVVVTRSVCRSYLIMELILVYMIMKD